MMEDDTQRQLRQLGQALENQFEDTLTCDQCQAILPDYVSATVGVGAAALAPTEQVAVEYHLALCPHCTAAHQQVQAWFSQSLSDTIPTASPYPDFDLTFLTPQPTSATIKSNPRQILTILRQQGKQFLQDTLGELYLLLNLAPQNASGWAVKSGEENLLLARTLLSDVDVPGWEVEATAFAVDAEISRLEVSLYSIDSSRQDLSGITVTLDDGVSERVGVSDTNGLVEFDRVRRERLPSVVVHIRWTDI